MFAVHCTIALYLSPVLEKVFTEHILGGVLVVEHLGKEPGSLLCIGGQGHHLTAVTKLDLFGQRLVGGCKVRALCGWAVSMSEADNSVKGT